MCKSLWDVELLLEMQSTQDAFCGAELVILYEYHVQSGFFHVVFIVCFHKVSMGISMHDRFDHAQSLNAAYIFSTLICPIVICLHTFVFP